MKQVVFSVFCLIVFLMPLGASAQMESKTLVVYFSCTNNTKNIADHISEILGADKFRIEPSVPYSAADLNYNDSSCRANQEQNDNSARPAISNTLTALADYDVVYIGFPIWWGKLPKILYTFFESQDFSGKTILPFCTSGSSGIASAVSEIRSLEPAALVNDGNRFSANASLSTVKSWVDGVQPTALENISVDVINTKSQIYNLKGQPVDGNTVNQILIQNGKKVINNR